MQTTLPARKRGEYDRSKTREQRNAERRRLLLDAAAAVFAERGVSDTTVGMIVERARVSRRAFYAEFENIHDALRQAAQDARDQVLAGVVTAMNVTRSDNPAEQLRSGMILFLTRLHALGPLARVLNREAYALGPEFARERTELTRTYARMLNDRLRPLYEQGVIRKEPNETTSFMLMAGVYATAMTYVEEGRSEDEMLALIPHIVDLVARAYI